MEAQFYSFLLHDFLFKREAQMSQLRIKWSERAIKLGNINKTNSIMIIISN
jgi:hypothetical protein